jgi:hypothetical protein
MHELMTCMKAFVALDVLEANDGEQCGFLGMRCMEHLQLHG